MDYCTCVTRISNAVDKFLSQAFRAWGRTVAYRPLTVILGSVLLVLLSCGGMVKFEEEQRRENTWIPKNSAVKQHFSTVQQSFSKEARVNTIFITAKDAGGAGVLAFPVLQEALGVCNYIRKDLRIVASYQDQPARNWTLENLCERRGAVCYFTSLLDAFQYDLAQLKAHEKDLLLYLSTLDRTRTLRNAFGSPFNLDLALGGLKKDANGTWLSAQVLRVEFKLENRGYNVKGKDADPPANSFEQAVVDWLGKKPEDQHSLLYTAAYPFTRFGFTEEINNQIKGDLGLVGASIMLILAYMTAQLGQYNRVESRVAVSVGGMVGIGLSMAMAYGLGSLFSVHTEVHSLLPFLLVGVGVDDMFVLTNELDLAREKHLRKGRYLAKDKGTAREQLMELFAEAMAKAGPSMTTTSLTNMVAFAISATTVLPALSSFCIWALIGVFGAYFSACTLFCGLLVLDTQRQSQDRLDCCCCFQRRDIHQLESVDPSALLTEDVQESNKSLDKSQQPDYASELGSPAGQEAQDKPPRGCMDSNLRRMTAVLLRPMVKATVIVVFLCILGAASLGLADLKVDFKTQWFIPSNSYLQGYYRLQEQYFGNIGVPVGIYVQNYSPYQQQELLRELSATVQANQWINKDIPYRDWFGAFERAVNASGKRTSSLSKGEFEAALTNFFNTPANRQYAGDVVMQPMIASVGGNETHVDISRSTAFYVDLANTRQEVDAMNSLCDSIKAVGDRHGVEAFAFSFVFPTFVQTATVPDEGTKNVLLTFFCVFLVVLVLLASPALAMIVTLVVAMCLGDLLGYMAMWDVDLNGVSVANLCLAIGISVDYSIHIAHAFIHKSGTRDERAMAAMTEMGVAVVNGAVSTLLAVVVLSASSSYIFVLFFKMFFLTLALGAGHALLLLPVLLSLIGPLPHPDVASSSTRKSGVEL